MELCLDFVKLQNHLDACKIHKFLTNFGPIIVEALQHCSESQMTYGQFLETLSDVLGVFFQKTNELALKFMDIVRDNVDFDCSITYQLDMMCDVLGYVSRIGKFAPCVGVRCTSETWKLYANLTTKHTADLQGHLVLQEPLALCEQYTDHLNGCHSTLLNLLLTLYRSSELAFELCSKQSPSPLINRILIVGADPLLKQLLANSKFCKEILKSNRESDPEAWTVLLHTTMQQLVTYPPECRRVWLSSECSSNIFFMLSSTLDQCQENCNSNPQNTWSEFYKLILTTSVTLAAVLSSDEVESLESVLLHSTLSDPLRLWRTIYFCDLWTAIVRISGPSFCLSHLEYLASTWQQLPQGRNKTVVTYLIQRLMSIMPSKFRPTTEALVAFQQSSTSMDDITSIEVLHSFIHDPPRLATYKSVLQVLDTISTANSNMHATLVPFLVKLWHFVDGSKLGVLLASKILKVSRDGHQSELFACISSAYSALLQDSDSVVQLAALQSFDEFAHTTTHEIIVAQTVSGSRDLQKMVSDHLQSKPESSKESVCCRQFHGVSFVLHKQETDGVPCSSEVKSNVPSDVVPPREDTEKPAQNAEQQKIVASLLTKMSSATEELLRLKKENVLEPMDLLQLEAIASKLSDIFNPFHDQ
ncbi:hypothetical protein B566_EDAN002960 [Ephemera danica]|nr:hypothetical protein B566_EDAN002960 [Ephemera danica]